MICRVCGTEIADKAIVCYRCGTGTAEAVRKPAEIRRRRAGWLPLIVLVVLLVLAFFAARAYHVFGVELWTVEIRVSAVGVLIDFPSIHA